MRPSVLILDEPTAGLDPRGRDRILSMLEQLHAESHTTIVMVSHSMDDMARLATRLIVMAEGKVLATGTPREIFAQEEMMSSAGLGVPQVSSLCRALRAKGFDLPPDLYRPEELKKYILELWQNRKQSVSLRKEEPKC
jgi:energy-coupling factor transport system ATP-binding protein